MIVVKAPTPEAPEPLSESVSVGLTAADKQRLRDAAEAKGVSMAAYIRTALLLQLNSL